MRTIPLTQGKVALVDDDLWPYLMMHKWCAYKSPKSRIYYAATKIGGKVVGMHEILLEVPSSMERDHRDGNGLNNQIQNLRISSRSNNAANTPLTQRNRSGFKGVSRLPNGKWRAQIKHNGKTQFIGSFSKPEDAAMAYDRLCIAVHKEFALTNSRMGLI